MHAAPSSRRSVRNLTSAIAAPLVIAGAFAAGGCASAEPGDEGSASRDDPAPATTKILNDAAEQAPPQPRVVSSTSPSRVLGYVNGEVVTYRDVALRLPSRRVLSEDADLATLEKSTFYDILTERLVDQAAVESGIDLARDDMERIQANEVRRLERAGGKLDAYLAERDMTRREWEDVLRRRERARRYMSAAVGLSSSANVRVRARTDTWVRPTDVVAAYEANPERFKVPAVARVRKLTILSDLDAPDREAAVADARRKAEAALARLRAGEDWVPVFRDVTRNSPEPDPADGLIELTERGKAQPWIEEQAFDKPRGALSEILQKGPSFHILRSEGVTPARTIPFEEAQPRLEEELRGRKFDAAYYEVCLSLLEEATVRPQDVASGLREHLSAARRKATDPGSN
ncbi:MAG: hypothetical protein HMLKMBBP_01182 [Planctomycetes bacterium]|nr:hypothetical protein [Planctomycetota bacterium]